MEQSPPHSPLQKGQHINAPWEIGDSFGGLCPMISTATNPQGPWKISHISPCPRLDLESEKDFVSSPPIKATTSAVGSDSGSSSLSSPPPRRDEEPTRTHISPQESTSSPDKPQKKGRKRKQRPKTPVQFDDKSQAMAKRPAKRQALGTTAAAATGALSSNSPALIEIKRAAADKSTRSVKKHEAAAPKETPRVPVAVKSRSKRAPKRVIHQTMKQVAHAGPKTPTDATPPLVEPNRQPAVPDDPTVQKPRNGRGGSEARAVVSPRNNFRADNESRARGDVTDPILVPSEPRSCVSSTKISQPEALRSSKNEIPDSTGNMRSAKDEYQHQLDGAPVSDDPTPESEASKQLRGRYSEANGQRRSHLVERHANIQPNDDEQNASKKTASMTSWNKGPHPRSTLVETKQQDKREVKAPHRDGTNGDPDSAKGAPCSESHTTRFQPVTHGSQRAKNHETRRTLSVSELGSPVRIRRNQRGDPVGSCQVAKSESCDSEDEIDQALARGGRKRQGQNVRRKLVFSLRPPDAVPAGRRASGPYPAKVPGAKMKAANSHKQVQKLPDPFQIPDVQDKIQEQISAGFAPQQHGHEAPSHGHCSSSHRKFSSKGTQKPLRDDHGSEIARELHGVVDVRSFRQLQPRTL